MRRYWAALFLLLLGSCSPGGLDILSHPLAVGGTMADRTVHVDGAVILLVAPSDVFTCGNHISRWLEWGRKHPGRFHLVFTRPPTAAEQKQLLLFRIRPDAVLASSRAAFRKATPYEYLVSGRQIARTGQVEPGVPETPLLTEMEKRDRRAVAAQRL